MQRDDGSWLIAGSMPVDEMADRLSIALSPERNYHTAAGFALDQLGSLPAIGESFDHQGWRFEVIDLDGRRIDKILARRFGAGRRASSGLMPKAAHRNLTARQQSPLWKHNNV